MNLFEDRLRSWQQLRESCAIMPVDRCLDSINRWWFQLPWQPYYLHWDDIKVWPDPWQLLSDNVYCPLARGLGILYTITMLDRPDLQDSVLAETDQGNLVLAWDQKYILNWESEPVLNINPEQIFAQHSTTQQQLKQQLGLE